METRSKRDVVDRLLDGTLADQLADRRAQGLTWLQVARGFEEDFSLTISHETLRRWAIDLGVEPVSPKPADEAAAS